MYQVCDVVMLGERYLGEVLILGEFCSAAFAVLINPGGGTIL